MQHDQAPSPPDEKEDIDTTQIIQTSYDSMAPEDAQRALREGGTLLCIGVPVGTKFGIDCTGYTVGPKFMGIKMIPPGVHIAHYCPSDNRNQASAPRTSLFFTVKPRQILIYRWNNELECLVDLPDQERRQYETGVRRLDFDRNLAPYPVNSLMRWQHLTKHVDAQVVARLAPVQRFRPLPPRTHSNTDKKKKNGNMEMDHEEDMKIMRGDEEVDNPMTASGRNATKPLLHQNPPRQKLQQKMERERMEEKEEEEEEVTNEKNKKSKKKASVSFVNLRRFYSKIPQDSTTSGEGVRARKQLQHKINELKEWILKMEMSPMIRMKDEEEEEEDTKQVLKQGGSPLPSSQPPLELESARKQLKAKEDLMREMLSAVTSSNLDKTPLLIKLIEKNWGGIRHAKRVLGEVEFAFCSMMFGESMEGLEQWKKLTRLLCSCDKGVDILPDLFAEWTEVLLCHLKALPADFFIDELSKDNFLKACLRDYLEILEDSSGLPSRQKKAKACLQSTLNSKFGWRFRTKFERLHSGDSKENGVTIEAEEDGAVVVQLTQKQLEELNLM
eukprot:jgi/Bigna1/91941/estExt_fgenesh1_pg.C_1330001